MNKCLNPECGYEWEGRKPTRPKECPECKHRKWDKEKFWINPSKELK